MSTETRIVSARELYHRAALCAGSGGQAIRRHAVLRASSTLALKPGSEYRNGILRAAPVTLDGDRVRY
jgi:hypothetical protein